mmetsp:Transcript_93893/g.268871  ORF Transcript_93893/g.268871 Transcript_93893/m.268871 type:complete len:302 (+) Transcript_93893:1831-2736(+)
MVAVGERQDDRLANHSACVVLHAEEVLQVPLFVWLPVLVKMLTEPAEDVDAAPHVAKRCRRALAIVEPPDTLLGGAHELGEHLDQFFEWRHPHPCVGGSVRVGGLHGFFLALGIVNAELFPQHSHNVQPLRLRREGAKVKDVVDHRLGERMHAVDQIPQRVLNTRTNVFTVRGALMLEDEPGHLLAAIQAFRSPKAVRVAGGNDLDVVGNNQPVHAPVAHNLFEEPHRVARVHLVEKNDDALVARAHKECKLNFLSHPGHDVLIGHATMDVERMQGRTEKRAEVANKRALATPRLAHNDDR